MRLKSSGRYLLPELRDFPLHRLVLSGLLFLCFVKLPAELGVFTPQSKSNEGSGEQQDGEQDNEKHGHGLRASLGVLGPLFQC